MGLTITITARSPQELDLLFANTGEDEGFGVVLPVPRAWWLARQLMAAVNQLNQAQLTSKDDLPKIGGS